MIISTNSTSPISANNALTTVTSFYRVNGEKGLADTQYGVVSDYRINAKWVSNLSLSATDYICVVTYARNNNAYDSTNTPIAAYQHFGTSCIMINASGDVSATGKAVFANIEGNTYDKNIFLIPFSGGFVWHNESDNITEFVKPSELIGVELRDGIFTKHSGNTFLFTTNSNYVACIKLTNIYNNGTEHNVAIIDMHDKVVTIMQQNGEEYILTQHHVYHINSVGSNINVTELIPYNANCRPNGITFSQFVATQNHNIVLDNNGTWCECYAATAMDFELLITPLPLIGPIVSSETFKSVMESNNYVPTIFEGDVYFSEQTNIDLTNGDRVVGFKDMDQTISSSWVHFQALTNDSDVRRSYSVYIYGTVYLHNPLGGSFNCSDKAIDVYLYGTTWSSTLTAEGFQYVSNSVWHVNGATIREGDSGAGTVISEAEFNTKLANNQCAHNKYVFTW